MKLLLIKICSSKNYIVSLNSKCEADKINRLYTSDKILYKQWEEIFL